FEFEIIARLPIQLQRGLDPWSASATGKISQPLSFAAQRLSCQDTSHRPVAGLRINRFTRERRPTGPWLQELTPSALRQRTLQPPKDCSVRCLQRKKSY